VKLNNVDQGWQTAPFRHLDPSSPGPIWQVRARNSTGSVSGWSTPAALTISQGHLPFRCGPAPYGENVRPAPGGTASSGWTQTCGTTTLEWRLSFWYDQTGSAASSAASPDPGDLTRRRSNTCRRQLLPAIWYSYTRKTRDWLGTSAGCNLRGRGRFRTGSTRQRPGQHLAAVPPSCWTHPPMAATIQVRFHQAWTTNNDHKGWYIDDFSISSDPPPAARMRTGRRVERHPRRPRPSHKKACQLRSVPAACGLLSIVGKAGTR
jgi:hypothetical protein